ncbi:omptin family outer membrane protease [Mucilaginibacter robiniae]|uniref:Omptin family outer membrane protease n=1 Tax=Mucilaginibacter robiniae TaxID=2728022 RepID=A0A7L5E5E7_9SPHI|nr:omptin family outer membrane protease [Mucilaginibacter robiniae]QJD98231.1 omptin family outer membrane protease [Mucilaginibacter robiniae]
MKILLPVVALILSWSSVQAQSGVPLVDLTLAGGYESANLHWAIAGNANGQSPNIYSELKWHSVSGTLLNPQLQINVTNKWFLAGEYAKCFVKAGHATDADYANDNREMQTYNALLDSDEGHLIDYRIYTGYQILLLNKFTLSAFAGYTTSKEYLFLLQHAEDVSGQKNLRSIYQTQWKGGLIGLSAVYQIFSKVNVRGILRYSQLKYHASADWNLIDAFQHPVSFEQHANGFDLGASLTCTYQFNHYLSLFVTGAYSKAQTGTGVDNLYLDFGSTRTTQLNGVDKQLKSFMLGTTVHF